MLNATGKRSSSNVKLLQCGVCKGLDNPKQCKLFPCLHSVCLNCCTSANTDNKLICSACSPSETWDVNVDVKDHFLIQALYSNEPSKKCTTCSTNEAGKEVIAKYICYQCDVNSPEYLCVSCFNDHRRNRVTRDHALHKINKTANDNMCPIHPTDELSWYCVQCDKLTCKNCQLGMHQGHSNHSLKQHGETLQTDMQKKLGENEEFVKNLQHVQTYIDQRVDELTDNEMTQGAGLDDVADIIKRAVDQKFNKLKEEVRQFTKQKCSKLMHIKTNAECLKSLANQATCFGLSALKCSDQVVLHKAANCFEAARKRLVQKRLNRQCQIIELKTDATCSVQCSTENVLTSIDQLGELVKHSYERNLPKFLAASTEDLSVAASVQQTLDEAQQNIMQAKAAGYGSQPVLNRSTARVINQTRGIEKKNSTPCFANVLNEHSAAQEGRRVSAPDIRSRHRSSPVGFNGHQSLRQSNSNESLQNEVFIDEPNQVHNTGIISTGVFGSTVTNNNRILPQTTQVPRLSFDNQTSVVNSGADKLMQRLMIPNVSTSAQTSTAGTTPPNRTSIGPPIQVDLVDSPTVHQGDALPVLNFTLQKSLCSKETQSDLSPSGPKKPTTPTKSPRSKSVLNKARRTSFIPRYKRVYEEENDNTTSVRSSDTGKTAHVSSNDMTLDQILNLAAQNTAPNNEKPSTEPFVPYLDDEMLTSMKYGKSPFDNVPDNAVPSNRTSPPSLPRPNAPNSVLRYEIHSGLVEINIPHKHLLVDKPKKNFTDFHQCPKVSSGAAGANTKKLTPSKNGEAFAKCKTLNNSGHQFVGSSRKNDSRVSKSIVGECRVCRETSEVIACTECHKTFHSNHHVPPYSGKCESFVCGFCVEPTRRNVLAKRFRQTQELTSYEQQVCERILLELYCHVDSANFHRKLDDQNYLKVIKRPLSFDAVREKLDAKNYKSTDDFLNDLNKVFVNCDQYYEV